MAIYAFKPRIPLLPQARQEYQDWKDVREHLGQVPLQTVAIELARQVLVEAMEREADELCGGGKGKHLLGTRMASRHGRIPSKVPFGAALMEVRRPRLRREGREVQLSTYLAAQHAAFSPEVALEVCIKGTSQRGFAGVSRALQSTHEGFRHRSKSTVNRFFVKAAEAVKSKLQNRSLGGVRYLVIYVDGVVEQGHHVIAAMGLTEDGEKRVLGLREGSSESSAVCQELLADLLKRGLNIGNHVLAVIDGGKGLASALRAVFGRRVTIQRCRAHKLRNILEKVPDCERDQLKKDLDKAWLDPDPRRAKRMLEMIARRLEAWKRRPAANSLREGLSETLACNFLGLPTDSALTRTLVTTNPLESLYSFHDSVARRVCRWRSGRMVFRWTATSLAAAERGLMKIEDQEALRQLVRLLDRRAQPSAPAPSDLPLTA
jgi:transposase-like protein